LSPFLRALRDEQLSRMTFNNHRFFTPLEGFFEALEPYRHLHLIDAGTGLGRLPDEALLRGFNMLGIDLVVREEQSESVQYADAELFSYDEQTWLMMCRPDHSGWVYDSLERALSCNAGVFYVGLESNFELDLDDYAEKAVKRWDNVGEEGEHMLLFLPQDSCWTPS
jgi:hypothetical protein